jgi:hypothetical protein
VIQPSPRSQMVALKRRKSVLEEDLARLEQMVTTPERGGPRLQRTTSETGALRSPLAVGYSEVAVDSPGDEAPVLAVSLGTLFVPARAADMVADAIVRVAWCGHERAVPVTGWTDAEGGGSTAALGIDVRVPGWRGSAFSEPAELAIAKVSVWTSAEPQRQLAAGSFVVPLPGAGGGDEALQPLRVSLTPVGSGLDWSLEARAHIVARSASYADMPPPLMRVVSDRTQQQRLHNIEARRRELDLLTAEIHRRSAQMRGSVTRRRGSGHSKALAELAAGSMQELAAAARSEVGDEAGRLVVRIKGVELVEVPLPRAADMAELRGTLQLTLSVLLDEEAVYTTALAVDDPTGGDEAVKCSVRNGRRCLNGYALIAAGDVEIKVTAETRSLGIRLSARGESDSTVASIDLPFQLVATMPRNAWRIECHTLALSSQGADDQVGRRAAQCHTRARSK